MGYPWASITMGQAAHLPGGPSGFWVELWAMGYLMTLKPGLSSQRRGNHTSQRRCHKDRVINNIIAQGQTHIKSSQVKCIQIHSLLSSSFIRYFNNQISTIFSKSSKPFLVKNVLYQFPKIIQFKTKHL